MPSYTTRRDGRDKNWKPRVSGMTSVAGDSDWGQGGTPWDDDVLAASPSAPKKFEPSIVGDSDWGVGGEAWDPDSEPPQTKVRWDDDIPNSVDGDAQDTSQSNEFGQDGPDDDGALSDAGTETPIDHDCERDEPASESAQEHSQESAPAGPSALRFPEPVQFDWADEPQDKLKPIDYTSLPPGLNINTKGDAGANAAGGAGWVKKGKKKKNGPPAPSPLGATPSPSPAAGNNKFGKGKGKGKAQAPGWQAEPSESWRSPATPTTPQPVGQQSPAKKSKGKQAAVATLYADEVLKVHADASGWIDSAWDTNTAPTWD